MENSQDQLCRLCLKLSEDAVELFHFRNGLLIADLVKVICPIEIEMNESRQLPHKVCVECLELILDAIHLRDLSLMNDQELRNDVKEADLELDRFEEDDTKDDAVYVEALDEAMLDEGSELEEEQFVVIAADVIPKVAVTSVNCELCNATFCNASSLKRHQLRKHKDAQHFCDLCERSFKTKREIESHMKKTHRNSSIKFLYSEKLSIDLSEMYEKIDESKTFTCSFCCFYECDEDKLNQHLATHQDVVDSGKMYCAQCPTKIESMEFMIQHTRAHNEPAKTHRCLICSKAFPYDDKFLNHLRNHKRNQHKICFCPECGRKFSKPSILNDHIRFIHNKESLFCCPKCGQGFGSKSAVNGHIRRHIETDKFKCPFCPKSFSSHNHLNSHKAIHSTDRVSVI